MTTSDEPLPDRILKDLQQTGFPLEIQSASIFQREKWRVSHQQYYESPNGKSGSSDFIARQGPLSLENKGIERFTRSVVVECKKRSTRPWVFYRSKPFQDSERDLIALDRVKWIAGNSVDRNKILKIARSSHYFDPTSKFSVLGLEPFSGGKNDEIFEAISQVVFGSQYQISVMSRFFTEQQSTNVTTLLHDALFIEYPMIIFDGPMFELSYDPEHNSFQVSETNHIVHSYEYGSDRFFIDIVSKVGLETLLKRINEELN